MSCGELDDNNGLLADREIKVAVMNEQLTEEVSPQVKPYSKKLQAMREAQFHKM